MVVPVNEYAAGADNVFKGNVSPERRQELESITAMARSNLYGSWIGKRVVVTEVSIVPKVEEASQTEARVVCELTVDKDMLNPMGNLHGVCAAYLIDSCSTLVFITSGRGHGATASLDCVFHAPAPLGSKLRIINTGMAMGFRTMSSRTEIWDDTNKRLCVTAINVRLQPSPAKRKAKL